MNLSSEENSGCSCGVLVKGVIKLPMMEQTSEFHQGGFHGTFLPSPTTPVVKMTMFHPPSSQLLRQRLRDDTQMLKRELRLGNLGFEPVQLVHGPPCRKIASIQYQLYI